ncbi:hypothetical protein DFR50_101207 [Roseiarcus fermentans]|uniref:Uncharacterized protein n=1 Tax=Roseiarcus fermentans TaxID=1473586 RepID=A0A366FUB3_9HYPH|nr:hypothetical protein DFR50_101207 [Roseiarcus fermentans]
MSDLFRPVPERAEAARRQAPGGRIARGLDRRPSRAGRRRARNRNAPQAVGKSRFRSRGLSPRRSPWPSLSDVTAKAGRRRSGAVTSPKDDVARHRERSVAIQGRRPPERRRAAAFGRHSRAAASGPGPEPIEERSRGTNASAHWIILRQAQDGAGGTLAVHRAGPAGAFGRISRESGGGAAQEEGARPGRPGGGPSPSGARCRAPREHPPWQGLAGPKKSSIALRTFDRRSTKRNGGCGRRRARDESVALPAAVGPNFATEFVFIRVLC